MPAPSPVFFSQPHAPRCSRLSRTSIAFSTIEWVLRPLRSTTNPTPHASCSCAGSYKPCFLGVPVLLISPNPHVQYDLQCKTQKAVTNYLWMTASRTVTCLASPLPSACNNEALSERDTRYDDRNKNRGRIERSADAARGR